MVEWMTPYVDDGLDPGRRGELEAHVAACPPCRARLTEEQGARTALRRCAARLTDELPPGLRSRCEALARDARAPRRAWFGRAMILTAATATVAILATVVLPPLTARSPALLATQLAADHMKCFGLFPVRGLSAGEVRAAERELAAQGWPMRIPDSSDADGLRLLDVRRCISGRGRIPHVMYESGGTRVSLFKLDGEVQQAGVVSVLGYQCRLWQRDGQTFALVGPDSAGPALTRAAAYVQREAR
jgi:anti-sigma factor RsiW